MGGSDNLQLGTRDGRVEICVNNAWGTICRTAFGIPDAQVACYELGGFHREGKAKFSVKYYTIISMIILCGCEYYTGAVVLSAVPGSGSGPIFLDQLNCNGTEGTLLECVAFTGLGLSTCDHSQDVGVRCRGRC